MHCIRFYYCHKYGGVAHPERGAACQHHESKRFPVAAAGPGKANPHCCSARTLDISAQRPYLSFPVLGGASRRRERDELHQHCALCIAVSRWVLFIQPLTVFAQLCFCSAVLLVPLALDVSREMASSSFITFAFILPFYFPARSPLSCKY